MKKHILPILLLIMIIGGCRPKPPNEVVFWHVMGGPLGKTLDSMVADFSSAKPGPKIDPISMGSYTALSQKLMASVAAGNEPLLAQSYEAWTSQLLEKDAVKPFGDFIAEMNDTNYLDDFFPVMLAECSRNGKLTSLPFNKSVPVYYYNKDLFAKAGLDPEKFPATWDEFVEAAQKLTLDSNADGNPDQWATAFPVGSAWMFQCLVLQNGGEIFSSDGNKVVFDSPEGIEALQYMVDLIYRHKVAFLTTGYEHQNDFLSGRVAMIQSSSASLAYMSLQKIPFNMGIAPLPAKKRKAVVLSGTNIIMFRKLQPDLMERGWQLVKWMMESANTARWSAETSYLPVRKSAFEQKTLKEKFAKYPGLESAYRQLEYAYPEPNEVIWNIGRSIMDEDGLQPALKGFKTPAEALHKAAKKINQQF
jgi:ABC-type glycerol-3-phosphate transport system substrate-binding protein